MRYERPFGIHAGTAIGARVIATVAAAEKLLPSLVHPAGG